MKISLETNLNENQLNKVKEIYNYSFPDYERKPFEVIEQAKENGFSEIFGILADGEIAGLLTTIDNESLRLIDYYAIDCERRNQNIGSLAMQTFFKENPDRTIFLEIEDPFDKRAVENDVRRMNFYFSLGYRMMDYAIRLFGVPMRILSYGGSVSFDAYYALLASYFKSYTDTIPLEMVDKNED